MVILRLPHRLVWPLLHLHRRIKDNGSGSKAVFEPGSVNKRLKRGAWLAFGLRGAVELSAAIRITTRHGQHAAGMRIEHQHGAIDFRYLLKIPSFLFICRS